MNEAFTDILNAEVARIDAAGSAKRHEHVIEGFSKEDGAPKAIIDGKKYTVFNSNDYLGLRLDERIQRAEHAATEKFGTGPGAVRFISGTLTIHKELERAIAKFLNREDAMLFSSSFAVNLAVIHCLLKGQSKDSLVGQEVLVVSDQLNHRSIIDGIRVAGLSKEQKAIFKHLDAEDLRRVLMEAKGKYKRVVIVTDGVFSMLGEYQDLKALNSIVAEFSDDFEEGIITIVDDAHGVGGFGKTGRGTEEVSGGKADVMVGTLGKGFGADGGYVAGSAALIAYLRESAATYIYSNNISPGTAAAALESIRIIDSDPSVLERLQSNIAYFKKEADAAGFSFATDSQHPIQPLLMKSPEETKRICEGLYEAGYLVTAIFYPVVPKGKDEIRVQISAAHTKADLDAFIKALIALA